MKTMRLAFAFAALFLAALALLTHKEPSDLDAAITDFLNAHRIDGAVLAFGRPGQPPMLRAYGDADPQHGRAMLITDRLKIASLSKPVTSAAILALIDKGAFHLDSPLHALFPDLPATSDIGGVTIRQLLQHSAGWDRAQSFDPFFVDQTVLRDLGIAPSELASCGPIAWALYPQPLQFTPGERHAYSNLGYCWLGQLIARYGTGEYGTSVQALIPETSDFSLNLQKLDAVHPIAETEAAYLVNRPAVVGPAGGWIASAKAYFQFASRPIDPRVLTAPPYASGRSFYGLGWRVWPAPDGPLLTHYGAMPGGFSVVLRQQGGPLMVILFNGRPKDDLPAFLQLKSALTALPLWQAQP